MSTRAQPRERLLDATIDLLRQSGVHGTGIAEVLRVSGTARQSIYQHFPGGKTELVAAATVRAGEFMTRLARNDPHGHVDARVDWWIDQLRRHDYSRGCPVAAAALAGADSPEIVAAAGSVFDDWVHSFVAVLVEAGADPEGAVSLARFQISAFEGAIVTSRALRSTEPMEDARAQLHRLIDALLAD